MLRLAFRVVGVGLAVLATLIPSPSWSAGATPSSTDSWTFEKAWFRGEKHSPVSFRWFDASGILDVGPSSVTFHSDKRDLTIPISAIREITTGHMKGDSQNDWAIVNYDEGGTNRVVGFKDGKGLGGGPNTVAIMDAIRRVMSQTAPSEGAAKDTSVGDVRGLTWKEFDREIKEGFPRAPESLVTDPNTMGLLLIDGDLKSGLYGFGLDGVGLVRLGTDGAIFRAGPAGGRGLNDVVLFTGLEPGEYVVKMVRGSSAHGWAALEAPESPDLRVQIEAGKVYYLGKLHLKSKGKGAIVEKELDQSREMKVWTRFAAKYTGTAWAALAEQRSRAVQGQ